jgi:hypothetical protein
VKSLARPIVGPSALQRIRYSVQNTFVECADEEASPGSFSLPPIERSVSF